MKGIHSDQTQEEKQHAHILNSILSHYLFQLAFSHYVGPER
jgi:hypothetical protein